MPIWQKLCSIGQKKTTIDLNIYHFLCRPAYFFGRKPIKKTPPFLSSEKGEFSNLRYFLFCGNKLEHYCSAVRTLGFYKRPTVFGGSVFTAGVLDILFSATFYTVENHSYFHPLPKQENSSRHNITWSRQELQVKLS